MKKLTQLALYIQLPLPFGSRFALPTPEHACQTWHALLTVVNRIWDFQLQQLRSTCVLLHKTVCLSWFRPTEAHTQGKQSESVHRKGIAYACTQAPVPLYTSDAHTHTHTTRSLNWVQTERKKERRKVLYRNARENRPNDSMDWPKHFALLWRAIQCKNDGTELISVTSNEFLIPEISWLKSRLLWGAG